MQYIIDHYRGETVLITGATGFAGAVLTRKLAEAGANIRAIARASSNLEPFADLDIDWYHGDVFDEKVLLEAVEGVNYIFHVAAAFREEKATEEDFRRVHLYSTQILAKAVTGKPGFKCFLHVSTVGVHGHIAEPPADENYRFSPGDEYQRTKLEGELWLGEYGKKHDLPFSIVRPAPIYGPGDMRLLKLFKMVDNGFNLMLGKGKGIMHFVHVDDVTNVFLYAAAKKEGLGETFIAVGETPISIIDLGKIIGKAINKNPRTIRLPLWPFYLASDICKVVCTWLGIAPPIYRRRVDTYTKDRIFDNSKIKNVLGYRLLHPIEEGMIETAHFYQEKGLIKGGK